MAEQSSCGGSHIAPSWQTWYFANARCTYSPCGSLEVFLIDRWICFPCGLWTAVISGESAFNTGLGATVSAGERGIDECQADWS